MCCGEKRRLALQPQKYIVSAYWLAVAVPHQAGMGNQCMQWACVDAPAFLALLLTAALLLLVQAEP
jgi:hypothetical protein